MTPAAASSAAIHTKKQSSSIRRYRFAGLEIETAFALPELGAPRANRVRAARPILAISVEDGEQSWGALVRPVHRRPDDQGGIEFSVSEDRAHFLVRFPGLADFLVSTSSSPLRVRCLDARSGDGGHTLRHLLLDQVLPRVLAHAGHTVLHAGLIRYGASAVAILGSSGAGKSTLCAAFGASGGALLSDDGLLVTDGPAGFAATANYPSLRLWPASLRHLFPAAPPSRPMAGYTSKLRIEPPAADPAGAVPLAALVVLSTEPAAAISLSPLPPAAACMSVVANGFALDASDRSAACRRLEAARRLVAAVPAYRLAYPRDFAVLPEVCRLLATLVSGHADNVTGIRFGAQ